MKTLMRTALFFLTFAIFPVSLSYAAEGATSWDGGDEEKVYSVEEAKGMIDALPTAGDAIKGEVKQNASDEYYDIHGRQLAYRENAKELRDSLDARREIFEKPRLDVIDRHRDVVGKVYAAEMAAYQEKTSEGDDTIMVISDDIIKNNEKTVAVKSDVVEDSTAVEVIEKTIPVKEGDDPSVRRKVVMPDNAPDFDPSNL